MPSGSRGRQRWVRYADTTRARRSDDAAQRSGYQVSGVESHEMEARGSFFRDRQNQRRGYCARRQLLRFRFTGYLSLDVRQSVEQIESVGKCVRRAPFPNFSGVKPDKSVHEYLVEMHVNGSRPIVFSVSESGRSLRPWQVYASYFLTGGYTLYGMCGDGFVVDKISEAPEVNLQHFDEAHSTNDMAAFDLDKAARFGKKDLHLRYTCLRP